MAGSAHPRQSQVVVGSYQEGTPWAAHSLGTPRTPLTTPPPAHTCDRVYAKATNEYPFDAPRLELRELRGFAQCTRRKKSRSCAYSNVTSRPQKILATNVPPRRSTCVVICSA